MNLEKIYHQHRMNITIKTASPDEWQLALSFFYHQHDAEERNLLVQQMLDSHHEGKVSLEQLLVAWQEKTIVGVMLLNQQPDSSVFFWMPVVKENDKANEIINQLLVDACQRMKQVEATYAQMVLMPEELDRSEQLLQNGFEQLATLSYLQRDLAESVMDEKEKRALDVTFDRVISFDESLYQTRFAKLIESTYEGTLDCPNFTADRDGESALLSHQNSGVFTPDYWLLFEVAGDDVGLLLLNDHPDQSAWEIVYMGVAPQFRGRGYGKKMLQAGLQKVTNSEREYMLLAVDCENRFASTIYENLGFVPIANRTVFLRYFS